jgi:tetratricopeptide (TPR) repeat protein
MRPEALLAVAPALVVLAVGCGLEPVAARWSADLAGVERAFEAGRYDEALAGFRRLAAATDRSVDRDLMALREAETLLRRGDGAAGVRRYLAVADAAQRRMDRARARYRVAAVADERGQRAAARRLYRRLVRTYPNLMPGLGALARLERLAREEGPAAVAEHLAWTHRVYPSLAHTELADNFVYFAARVAYDGWVARGDARLGALAEQLLSRMRKEHAGSGTWDDALWDLSWLLHRQGRFAEEVDAIRLIRAARGPAGIFGNPGHTYYWVGELRVARLMMTELADPAGAVASFDRFLADYPTSRWRDDALYFQGCAYLRLRRPAAAEAAWARIPEVYAESKYLRRLDLARADPEGAHCVPPAFEEQRS